MEHIHNHITFPQGASEIDPLGVEAWTASRGLKPHVALSLAASVLSGIAGPMHSFPLPSIQLDWSGVNLIGVDGDTRLAMAVAQLTGSIRSKQDALIIRAKEFTASELDDAMYVPGLRHRNADYLAQLGNPEPSDFDVHNTSAESRLERDTEIRSQSVLYDSLTRPRVVLSGSLPPDLPRALAECHGGVGFAAGAVESLPASTSKRNARINQILAAQRGIMVERSSRDNRTKVTQEIAQLAGILRFPKPDFSWLVGDRRDFLTSAIPIASALGDDDEAVVDEYKAAGFQDHFGKMAVRTLACRRSRICVSAAFGSDEVIIEFMRLQRAFQRAIHDSPENCRVHCIAGLPAAIAWSLLLLAGNDRLDDYILHAAFDASRRVHADCIRLFLEHDQAALAERRLVVARKLVLRLVSIGPCKRRVLVRCLDQQALQLHEPVIQVLIGFGIVTEDANRLLRLGGVSIHRLTASNLIQAPPP